MDIIKAEMRDPAAKAKQLRRLGIIPCAISGAGLEESLSVQISQIAARQLRLTRRNGSKVDVRVGPKTYHTLIRKLEYSYLNDAVVHIGFDILDAGKKVNSVADIVLLNKDKVPGAVEQIQMQVLHAAEPEYLLDIVTVDLAGIPVGTTLTVGDIPEFQSDKIELQVDMDSIVLRVNDKRRADARFERVSDDAAK
ncbi:MAG TPA: hypothetical protein VN446_05370 [Candidatus Acidoferrum sp.]|nr:hypothetical protein [Candidatus Acidoferrum sp.]